MIKNAKTMPKVFYGLHMVEGVAEYREPGSEPYRVMIGEQAIKNMDASYAGKPVYVSHVYEVSLENLQQEADGYVIESFYNEKDGKHWAKFIVVSDRGHEAIRSGWRLSNAYDPKQLSGGGLWHGVEYAKEIISAVYEHLAIVSNPRYDESIILTPEQFKEYNEKKDQELKRLANSINEGDSSMFKIFKKTKVENSAELETMVVTLPKSGRDVTITQLVNEADTIANMNGYANGDHMVKVGDGEMSVNELCAKYGDMLKQNEAAAEEEKKNAEGSEDEKKENEDEEEKKNDDDKAKEEKKNDDEDTKENDDEIKEEKKNEDLEEKKKTNARYNALKNAHETVVKTEKPLELSSDKVARGKARYGS